MKTVLILSIFSLVLMAPAGVRADEGHNHATEALSEAPAAVPAAPEVEKTDDGSLVVDMVERNKVNNKICPVSVEKVGQMGPAFEVVHNGKTYQLCCEMCAKEFAKDPDKYSKIADDEVSAAAPETVPAE